MISIVFMSAYDHVCIIFCLTLLYSLYLSLYQLQRKFSEKDLLEKAFSDTSSQSASSSIHTTTASVASDTEKIVKKIKKHLKHIQILKEKDPVTLSEKEQRKISKENDLEDELALLHLIRVEVIRKNIVNSELLRKQ